MNKPSIVIKGKTIEMPEPKARLWRIWVEFDESKKEWSAAEFIEAHCRMIATLYGEQVTAEELLDELALSDVMKVYRDAANYFSSLLYSKFETIRKNSGEAAEGDEAI